MNIIYECFNCSPLSFFSSFNFILCFLLKLPGEVGGQEETSFQVQGRPTLKRSSPNVLLSFRPPSRIVLLVTKCLFLKKGMTSFKYNFLKLFKFFYFNGFCSPDITSQFVCIDTAVLYR